MLLVFLFELSFIARNKIRLFRMVYGKFFFEFALKKRLQKK